MYRATVGDLVDPPREPTDGRSDILNISLARSFDIGDR